VGFGSGNGNGVAPPADGAAEATSASPLDVALLAKLVEEHPNEVQESLAALDAEAPIQLDAVRALAGAYGMSVPALLLEVLAAPESRERFLAGMRKRGIAAGVDVPPALSRSNSDPAKLSDFVARATTFRCRILVNTAVQGSGCIVSPNLVLTAWHVIAGAGPDPARSRIDVLFSDGTTNRVRLPVPFSSICGDGELKGILPTCDAEVADKNDVALLLLDRPAGAYLGVAQLPDTRPDFAADDAVFIAHYAEGKDQGFGSGSLNPLQNLTARWGHNVGTRGGSSGGGCFTNSFTLAGLHQGKAGRKGRMVPVGLFLDALRPLVARDLVPDTVWSTDGTAEGQYIIGRPEFFQAFAAAARKEGRVRGLRIKRSDAAADLTGIPFSYAMLEQLVTPRTDMRVARVAFDELVNDVPAEIVRRAAAAGVAIEPVAAGPGIDAGHSAPEAVGADRGRRAAADLNARAGELGFKLWIFFEHPSVVFGDQHRSALEGFIDQALRLPNLRLVVAGFEAVPLPGQEFRSPAEAEGAGPPGMLVEYLAGFRLHDVEAFLDQAATALGYRLPLAARQEYARDAVFGVEDVNGVYEPWQAGEVAQRLRPLLRRMGAEASASLS